MESIMKYIKSIVCVLVPLLLQNHMALATQKALAEALKIKSLKRSTADQTGLVVEGSIKGRSFLIDLAAIDGSLSLFTGSGAFSTSRHCSANLDITVRKVGHKKYHLWYEAPANLRYIKYHREVRHGERSAYDHRQAGVYGALSEDDASLAFGLSRQYGASGHQSQTSDMTYEHSCADYEYAVYDFPSEIVVKGPDVLREFNQQESESPNTFWLPRPYVD
jgi:hypothetical protein